MNLRRFERRWRRHYERWPVLHEPCGMPSRFERLVCHEGRWYHQFACTNQHCPDVRAAVERFSFNYRGYRLEPKGVLHQL